GMNQRKLIGSDVAVMEMVLCCEFENQRSRLNWLSASDETQGARHTAAARMLGRIAVAAVGKPDICLHLSI
ncbi:hypothetical protein, partial [Rhizobium sp. Pop5]|uniref:hypothetical protein n=1 Tax=Rhizobium sp. Pop5 TaxID=1223565 RepID=UPI000283A99C